MSDWIYPNGIACVAVPTRNGIEAVGFVYKITINDHHYIGKKQYYSKRKVPKGKKELASQDGRASKKKLVVKESNWKSYCSSSDEVKRLVELGHVPHREILRVCYSLKEMSYFENKYLYEVFHMGNVLNRNLSGTYFKEEVEGYGLL